MFKLAAMDLSAIDIPPEWIYGAAGFAIGLVLMGLRVMSLERDNARLQAFMEAEDHAFEEMGGRFKLTAQEAVQQAHESFLKLAQERLTNAQKDGAHDLEKRQRAIDEMIKPVHKNLEALNQAIEQVKGTDQTLRQEIKSLNQETAKLVGALRDPAAQGQWGEFILEGLLDKSGLIKGVHYDTQVAFDGGRQRPDAVIKMQDGFNIIVDSKAPLNEFAQRLSDNLSEEDYNGLMQNLARQVREHVKKLSVKGYWENLDSPDFTVMFLPSEQLYSIALRADPELVEFAASRDIIIASPTLLMSLLRVVGMSWKQVELAQNAQEISKRGADLYNRLLTFTDKIEKIGKNLTSAMKGYNEAVGSLERSVLPAARKFKGLQTHTNTKEISEIEQLEESQRQVALSAEDLEEKKRA